MSQRTKKRSLRGKGGLVTLAVVAVLGVWLLIDLQRKPARDPDSLPFVSEYVHLESKQVDRVEVRRPKGDGFVLVKRGGKWAFESPKPWRASTENVDSWLKIMLEDATVSRTVEGSPSAATTGFDRPAGELLLRAGGRTRTLQVGKAFKLPGSSSTDSYYAREAGDGRVFMLAASQVEGITAKKADELREKRLLEIADEKEISKVALVRASGSLQVERRDEKKWEIVQPFRAPAGEFDIEDLLRDLKNAEADSFVEDQATDLAKYGLDRPRLTVNVTTGRGLQTLLFGKDGKDGKVYSSRQGSGEVTLVLKATFDNLNQEPADLRDRTLVTLERDKITYVELKNAHGVVRLQKVSGNNWEIAGAPPAERKAKGDMAERVIDTVTGAAHKHVEETPKDLAKYGLDRPQITVTVNAGSGTSQVWMLGKKTKTGSYYAKGVPDAVFEVQDFAYSDLNVKPAAFRASTDGKK